MHRLGHHHATPLPFFTIHGESWYLALPNGRVSSDPSQPLLHYLSAQQAFPYWKQKHNLSDAALQDILWETLGQALSDKPPTYRMWLSKFSSGHSAVGKTMARWGQWDSDICPACQSTTKTTEHVLFCTHSSRTTCWHQQTSTLVKWLHNSDTHPDIISMVDHVLTHQGSSSFSAQAPPQLRKPALAQDRIGLFGFLTGRISSLWLPIQAHHLSSLGSTHSATLG